MSEDNTDLESLFDEVSSAAKQNPSAKAGGAAAPAAGDGDGDGDGEQMFNKLGQIVRQFHTALHELGLDQAVRDAANVLPEASDHLEYVVKMTEDAANKTLNAHDVAAPILESLHKDMLGLESRWNRLLSGEMNEEGFKKLAMDTGQYFSSSHHMTKKVSESLQQILMAQDFQDLTGQVIKRLINLNKSLETQLLHLLVESADKRVVDGAELRLLNGPAVSAQGKTDFLKDQKQVDDLLDSLGF